MNNWTVLPMTRSASLNYLFILLIKYAMREWILLIHTTIIWSIEWSFHCLIEYLFVWLIIIPSTYLNYWCRPAVEKFRLDCVLLLSCSRLNKSLYSMARDKLWLSMYCKVFFWPARLFDYYRTKSQLRSAAIAAMPKFLVVLAGVPRSDKREDPDIRPWNVRRVAGPTRAFRNTTLTMLFSEPLGTAEIPL